MAQAAAGPAHAAADRPYLQEAALSLSIVQAEEEETRGMWGWRHDGHACEHSFETDDDAMLDAYERLDLLQRVLDGGI